MVLMNEKEIEALVHRTIVKMYIDNSDLKDTLESRVADVIRYIEHGCVCANYNQKHRTELLKKLTGKNKTFKYTGA